MHTGVIDGEPSHFLGVLASPHFQYHETAMHRVLFLDVPQEDDRVGECGNVLLAGALAANQGLARRGAEPRYFTFLDEGGKTDQEFAETGVRGNSLQGGEAVDRDPIGLELIDEALYREQVIRQSLGLRIETNDFELCQASTSKGGTRETFLRRTTAAFALLDCRLPAHAQGTPQNPRAPRPG
jgi:hypothetical protein